VWLNVPVIVLTVLFREQADVLPSFSDFEPVTGVNMTDRKDLATEGTKDRLKGTAKQVEGRIRGTVGGAAGDTGEQLKGKGQEIKGKLQEKIGRAKQDMDPDPGVDEE
jgi:uncharacterized protein YjbJ (UPF0337 family)